MSDIEKEIQSANESYARYKMMIETVDDPTKWNLQKVLQSDSTRFANDIAVMQAQPLTWIEGDFEYWRVKLGTEQTVYVPYLTQTGVAIGPNTMQFYDVPKGQTEAVVEVNGKDCYVQVYVYFREHVEEIPEGFEVLQDYDKVFERRNHIFIGFDDPRDAMLFKLAND